MIFVEIGQDQKLNANIGFFFRNYNLRLTQSLQMLILILPFKTFFFCNETLAIELFNFSRFLLKLDMTMKLDANIGFSFRNCSVRYRFWYPFFFLAEKLVAKMKDCNWLFKMGHWLLNYLILLCRLKSNMNFFFTIMWFAILILTKFF